MSWRAMLRIALVVLVLIAVPTLIAACAPVRTLNALTPSDTYRADDNIHYGPDPRQQLDVYQPRVTASLQKPAKGWPVVVFFYGGSWNRGDRGDYRFAGEALASRGMVAVLADYRLYPQVRYPDFLRDCAAAVAWVRREASRYDGDTDRLYVMGHSAGGYNAAMLALDARWLAEQGLAPAIFKGWIGLAGPYEFLPMTNIDAQPVFFHPNYPPGTQPIDYASPSSPRTFLGAAAADDLVDPDRNTRALAQKLQGKGVPVTLRMYDRVSHVTLMGAFARPLSWLAPVADDVAAFVLGDGPH
jgi:acetyl esterase/lipase